MYEGMYDMGKADTLAAIELPKTFIDVLYLTDKGEMPAEIKWLLKRNKLSFFILPTEKFPLIRERIDTVGTVIIDVEAPETAQQQNLARIIESLEAENIGVILLTQRVQMPIRSFSLAPTKSSFSMTNTVESISTDDLWVRISLNLAYRKRSAGMAVKPAVRTSHSDNMGKSRLSDELQRTGVLVDNLADQLRMAGQVQRDFLPAQLPNCDEVTWAATFLPAEWVSGDIYDVTRLDEQHIGFYVADVVGHAMPAALLTIFIKQALVMRETFGNNYRIYSPAEVMKNLNARMSAQKLSGYQFATCCYCLLNIKTLHLTYARAGHPYPILIRPGQQPEQLQGRGSLLGIFEHAEYVQETIQLQPRDKLILYSDGAEHLIGNFDESAAFRFSTDLCEMKDAPVVEIIDQLNVLIRDHQLPPHQTDDITIVGLEVL